MYGAAEADEAARNLSFNVTTPVQALVRNSQLYIPGGTKVSDRNFDHPILSFPSVPFLIHTFCQSVLQGFSDPAPFTSKSLRVRYLFRGRMHYAEIPDNVPVVLPLAGLFDYMCPHGSEINCNLNYENRTRTGKVRLVISLFHGFIVKAEFSVEQKDE